MLELEAQLYDDDIEPLYFLFECDVLLFVVAEDIGHFFDGGFEVYDLLGQGTLTVAFEFEHGPETAHVFVQTGELFGEGEL